MSKTFFTSDTHFYHESVIKFCNRPYGSIEHMNEELIKNWNSVVNDKDHLWFLGDFSFGTYQQTEDVLNRLNGIKHLIVGNHDRNGRTDKLFNRDWNKWFVDSHDYFRLKVDGEKLVLCHFPLASWERGYVNLHGHWHSTPGNCSSKWMQHDVGVDMNNYTPVLLSDAVMRAIENKEGQVVY
jgi:calcineurin-like phosphoesterase family protein